MLSGMRKHRGNTPNRCCHLISRFAHRAFFLVEDERTRLVEMIKRASFFSGVRLRGDDGGHVDANPVKAGIVDWPDKYEWCSFAAAEGGVDDARAGLSAIPAQGHQPRIFHQGVPETAA